MEIRAKKQPVLRSVGRVASVGHDMSRLECIFRVTVTDRTAPTIGIQQRATKRRLTAATHDGRHNLLPSIDYACGIELALLARTLLGEDVPKDWTWDDDEQTRSAHAALEGKKMPALELSEVQLR